MHEVNNGLYINSVLVVSVSLSCLFNGNAGSMA